MFEANGRQKLRWLMSKKFIWFFECEYLAHAECGFAYRWRTGNYFMFMFADIETKGDFSNIPFVHENVSILQWKSRGNLASSPYYSESRVSLDVAGKFVDKGKALLRKINFSTRNRRLSKLALTLVLQKKGLGGGGEASPIYMDCWLINKVH